VTAGAAELAEAIRRGERSPVEVVDEQIAMIECHDPQLNAAVVHRFDEAREEARERGAGGGRTRSGGVAPRSALSRSA
jgi:Asp-tRNA(Asn)/Glu-tRNA(Gln) amidotransferase A subunit family amidase